MKLLMRRLYGFFITVLLISHTCLASSTRTIDADSFISSDHTKTYSLPSTSDALAGTAATQTLTNKTISGASNTFVQLPISQSIVQEVPSGTINGTNKNFTVANTPATTNSVQVYLDGILLLPTTDYSVSGAIITCVSAPVAGQNINVVYAKY